MSNVIRATTPTITYKFKVVDVEDITTAFLTIKQNGTTIIEKDLDDAVVGEDTLSWTFTQAETLQMAQGKISCMINWLTEDGTRGASNKSVLIIDSNYKDEVI